MATKISNLPVASSLGLNDLFAIVQSSETRRWSVSTGGLPYTVATVAALTALDVPAAEILVMTQGYHSAGDGGSCLYRWNSSDTTAANGGTVLRPDSAPTTGRWNAVLWSSWVNVKIFGAYGDKSHDDTAAINACFAWCAANGRTAYLPYTTGYLISGQLTWSGAGGVVMDDAAFIYPTGTGYTALVVQGQVSELSVNVDGQTNILAGVCLGSTSSADDSTLILSTIQKVLVQNCNGYGVRIGKMYDSTIDALHSVSCGNSSVYAVSVNDDGGTTNESTISLIQCELSTTKALYISPNTFNCVFGHIHSERATGNNSDPTWVLGGNQVTYNSIRLQATNPSNAPCQINGSGTTLTGLVTEDAIPVTWGGTLGLPVTLITPSIAGTLSAISNQIGMLTIEGGIVATLSGQGTSYRIYGTEITVALTAGDGLTDPTVMQLDSCTVANINIAGSNSAMTLTNVNAAACSSLPIIGVYNNCTLTNSTAIGLSSRAGTFNGGQINADLTFGTLGPDNFYFNNVDIQGKCTRSGSPGVLFRGCRVGAGSDAGAPFNASPAGGTWKVGEQGDNILAASGQPQGWVCTTAGTIGSGGAFTNKPNL